MMELLLERRKLRCMLVAVCTTSCLWPYPKRLTVMTVVCLLSLKSPIVAIPSSFIAVKSRNLSLQGLGLQAVPTTVEKKSSILTRPEIDRYDFDFGRQNPSSEKGSNQNLENESKCDKPLGKCEQCTDSDHFLIPDACAATGRRQSFSCTKGDTSDTELNDMPPRVVYKSCDRTEEDEEVQWMRFQFLCFALGLASYVSIKQQKASAASLFDQRKLNLQKKRVTSNNDVEMSVMIRQDEVHSLLTTPTTTTIDSLAIV